ncbi:peptidase M28, partial [Bacillus nitratireducens]|nr:peptidase M28 [Bacillus nitratireducens]
HIILCGGAVIVHTGLRVFVCDVAVELQMRYLYDSVAGGGTDAGAIQIAVNGILSMEITIATRYIHFHASMLHRDDYENAVKLVVEVFK